MNSLFTLRRPSSRRHKLAALTLVAGVAMGLAAGAQAAFTTPATVSVGANSSATVNGEFTEPLVEYPAGSCPSQFVDPQGDAFDSPNCVHTNFVVNLPAGGTAQATVRMQYDGSWGLGDITVYDELGNVRSQAFAGTCPDDPNCAETPAFGVSGGETLDIAFSPGLFFCQPGTPGCSATFQGIISVGPCTGCGTGGGAGGVDPPIFVSDATVVEGDSGMRNAVFNLRMGDTSLLPVTVNYTTTDADPVSAVAGSDYLPTVGTVVFQPGETRKTISVPLLPDMAREPAETFNVLLSLPQPVRVGSIGDGLGIGRITNDDWGRAVTGSGRLLLTNGSLSLRTYEFWGWYSIRYRENSAFNFRATSISSKSFNDLTHTLHVVGSGVNAGHAVTFTLDATDNGAGASDLVVLTLSDGSQAQGTLATGDLGYRG